MATPAPTGGGASDISRELPSPESFLLPGELLFPTASQPQGVSWVIFLLFLMLYWQHVCQTCSGVPLGGVWGLAVGVPGEGSHWAWLAPVDVTAAGCTGSDG